MSDAFQRYQQAGLQTEKNSNAAFTSELISLINKHAKEQDSGTPDFILGDYLMGCLAVYNTTVKNRAAWRGEPIDKIFHLTYDNEIPIVLESKERGLGERIGVAKPEMFPGMSARHGKIVRLKPVFAPPLSEEQQAMELVDPRA